MGIFVFTMFNSSSFTLCSVLVVVAGHCKGGEGGKELVRDFYVLAWPGIVKMEQGRLVFELC